MDTLQTTETQATEQLYQTAAHLIIHKKLSREEVIADLKEKGTEEALMTKVTDELFEQINIARKDQAKKDMLYGALWCVGGTVATVANIGFIFWGAIVFGGIQFFKGLISYI